MMQTTCAKCDLDIEFHDDCWLDRGSCTHCPGGEPHACGHSDWRDALNAYRATYPLERALCDKAAAYAAQFVKPNGWTVLTKEEASHPDYAACDNAMRGRVEQFELLRNPPDKFTAYISSDGPLAVTVWTGDKLGAAHVNSMGPRHRSTGERQHYGRATIAGRAYAWQGPGRGMYARLKALKHA